VSWDTVSPGYRPLSWGYPRYPQDAPRVPRRQLAFSDEQRLAITLSTIMPVSFDFDNMRAGLDASLRTEDVSIISHTHATGGIVGASATSCEGSCRPLSSTALRRRPTLDGMGRRAGGTSTTASYTSLTRRLATK